MGWKHNQLVVIIMELSRSHCREGVYSEPFQDGFPSVTCMPNAACTVNFSFDYGRFLRFVETEMTTPADHSGEPQFSHTHI